MIKRSRLRAPFSAKREVRTQLEQHQLSFDRLVDETDSNEKKCGNDQSQVHPPLFFLPADEEAEDKDDEDDNPEKNNHAVYHWLLGLKFPFPESISRVTFG